MYPERMAGPGVGVRAVPGVRARAGTCAGMPFTLCWGCRALPGYPGTRLPSLFKDWGLSTAKSGIWRMLFPQLPGYPVTYF